MDEDGLLSSSGTGEGPSKIRMGELVKKYLQAQTLEVLGEDDLEDAVTRYVDKDDTDAIKEYVNVESTRQPTAEPLFRYSKLCERDTRRNDGRSEEERVECGL